MHENSGRQWKFCAISCIGSLQIYIYAEQAAVEIYLHGGGGEEKFRPGGRRWGGGGRRWGWGTRRGRGRRGSPGQSRRNRCETSS